MLTTLVALSLTAGPALFTVSGKAEVSHPWCGGAMPSPAQRETRTPETEGWVVKPGEQNSTAPVVATFKPKADGSFSLKLPAGKWCFVEANRSDVPPSEVAKRPTKDSVRVASVGTPDYACLDGVWRECSQVVVVEGPQSALSLTRYVPCGWQVRCPAKGELPPPPPPSAR